MKLIEKITILTNLFKDANNAAIDADPGEDYDGGTCNFDSPAFRIKGMRKKSIETAANAAGLKVCDFSWFGKKKWFWLIVDSRGQANRRSMMSTAATRVLKDFAEKNIIEGFEACQYCQID